MGAEVQAMYSFQGQSPFCLQFRSHRRLVLLRRLEGTSIYMVELSQGTPGCRPLPLSPYFLLGHWDVGGAWLAPCWDHTCPTVQEVLGLPWVGRPWLFPCTSFLDSGWTPPTAGPPVLGHGCAWCECGGELDGGPGGSAWGRGKLQCRQKALCSGGCRASSGLTKRPVSRMCPQPGGMALLAQASPSQRAQAGSRGL